MKHPHFTEAENLVISKIELKVARYHLALLRAAERAGKIPSARTVILRSLSRSFAKAFQP